MADKKVTMTGLYWCKTNTPMLEKHTVEKQVSVDAVDGEKPWLTIFRLREAAEAFNGKYVDGCADRSFYRFRDLP